MRSSRKSSGKRLPQRGKRRGENTNQVGGQGALQVYNSATTYTDRMSLRRFPGQVYNVILTQEVLSFMTSNTSIATFFSISTTLALLNGFTDFTAAFDQYRIEAVEVLLKPQINMNTGTSTNAGEVHTVIDYDDQTSLGSVAAALQYDNVITTPGYQAQRRCYRPRMAMAAFASSAFTSFANMKDQWIDAASTGVNHYGVKIAWTPTTISLTYDLTVRAHVQFRCTR